MKAIVWTRYGPPDVLEPREVEKPTPKENEVLIKVRAAAITAGDCEMRNLKFPLWVRLPMQLFVGVRKPTRVRILGAYLSGEIEKVGKDVSRFSVGDDVFGLAGMSFGAYAEHIALPEDGIVVTKPSNLGYDEAAPAGLGGLEALHFLQKADIQPGQKVLINGAGGSIGTYAVQLAKHLGAEVTAVDSAAKLDMLRSLGADHVIDYAQEDFTRNGQSYDVILDVVLRSPFSRIIRSLKEDGTYLLTNPTISKMIRGAWISRTTGRRVIFQFTNPTSGDLQALKELIEAGHLKPVIDRHYTMDQIVEAHRYVETGQKKGDVVLVMAQ